jgi:hypothetical protein
MTTVALRRIDPIAMLAAAIALAMIIVYIAVANSQDNEPLAWVVLLLALGSVLAAYGSWRDAPRRKFTLTVAAAGLLALGVLAILTIGVPILVAGALALWAAQRE